MDAEIVRQFTAAISSLDARMLEHTRASGKDRGITLQKLDDLRDHFEVRFDDLGVRIDDVCDKRRIEHGGFEERLAKLESMAATRNALEEGRKQASQAVKDAAKWSVEHGWKAILVLYVGFQAALPMLQQALAAPLHGLTQ